MRFAQSQQRSEERCSKPSPPVVRRRSTLRLLTVRLVTYGRSVAPRADRSSREREVDRRLATVRLEEPPPIRFGESDDPPDVDTTARYRYRRWPMTVEGSSRSRFRRTATDLRLYHDGRTPVIRRRPWGGPSAMERLRAIRSPSVLVSKRAASHSERSCAFGSDRIPEPSRLERLIITPTEYSFKMERATGTIGDGSGGGSPDGETFATDGIARRAASRGPRS
jgi:hypothetical protein